MVFPFKLFPFSEKTAASSVVLGIVLCLCILNVFLYSFRSIQRYKDGGIFTCVFWPSQCWQHLAITEFSSHCTVLTITCSKSSPFLCERGKLCNVCILFEDHWCIFSFTANNQLIAMYPQRAAKKIPKYFLAWLLLWLRSHSGLLFL